MAHGRSRGHRPLSASPPARTTGWRISLIPSADQLLPARTTRWRIMQCTLCTNMARSWPHRLPAHELWVENRSKHYLLPGPDGLETDCRPKAFSNSLDLVIACPAYVLSGAWKLQLPRNHTREALYSPRRASSVGLKLRLLLRPSRTRDSCRLGAASLACRSMFACLARSFNAVHSANASIPMLRSA
jgi:hypothetical protein